MIRNILKFYKKHWPFLVLLVIGIADVLLGIMLYEIKGTGYKQHFITAAVFVVGFVIFSVIAAMKDEHEKKEAHERAKFVEEYEQTLSVFPQYSNIANLVVENLEKMGKNPVKVLPSTWITLFSVWMDVIAEGKDVISDFEVASAIMHALNTPGGSSSRVMLTYRCIESMLVKPKTYSVKRENDKIVELYVVGYEHVSDYISACEEIMGKDAFQNMLVTAINQRGTYVGSNKALANILMHINEQS